MYIFNLIKLLNSSLHLLKRYFHLPFLFHFNLQLVNLETIMPERITIIS